MKTKYILLALAALAILFIRSHGSDSSGLNCSVIASGSCTTTALLFLKNDSNGYFNAHAQLPGNGTYPFAVCCDALSRNDTIDTACGDAVFLKLQQPSNSHVQQAWRSEYAFDACINSANGNVSCGYYNYTCPSNYTCLAAMASSNSSEYNQTNAHVSNCSQYVTKICCRLNSPPVLSLVYPENNSAITNRTSNFTWNATDPDNNTLTFDLYIYCNGGCSIDNRAYLGLNHTNFTLPSELKFFGDDNYWYTWYVTANDGSMYITSNTFNFTLSSLLSLTIINTTMNFGTLTIGQRDNTSDNVPEPFLLRNDGNSFVDVNISAQKFLWDSRPFASRFFQYKANNYTNESGSFNWSGSTTDWTDIPLTNQTFLNLLNYSDANDTAAIDILVEVPLDEGAGNKSAVITFTGRYVRVDI